MSNPTADDFARAMYAVSGEAVAVRNDPGDPHLPWRAYGADDFRDWRSDADMVSEGWQIVAPETDRTPGEHLAAAWEAAYVPEDGNIPADTRYIARHRESGDLALRTSIFNTPTVGASFDRRLIERPRPAEAVALDQAVDKAVRGHGDLTTPEAVRALSDALAAEGVRAAA